MSLKKNGCHTQSKSSRGFKRNLKRWCVVLMRSRNGKSENLTLSAVDRVTTRQNMNTEPKHDRPERLCVRDLGDLGGENDPGSCFHPRSFTLSEA